MREIVPGENLAARVELPAETREAVAALDQAIAARAQIVWEEHCSECAYPSCYASCVHYAPRADLHCRRFERGIETALAPGLEQPLMRIRFLKWGKLLGSGPAPMRPARAAARHALGRQVAGKIADAEWLPYPVRHGAGRAWARLEERSREREVSGVTGSAPLRADAFVIECVTFGDGKDHGEGESAVPFVLTISPSSPDELGIFQERLAFSPGYTRHVVEIDRIAKKVDLSRPFRVQIEPLVESPPQTFVFGAVDFVAWAGPPMAAVTRRRGKSPRQPAARAKCVVWDLDDTLWDGVLAEVGLSGVRLRSHVVDVIRALDARGILHSIVSKNSEAEALAALQRFGIAELFLHPQIGWRPKSEGVTRVATLLGIGVDTLAFVDDQPFERSEVSESLGCVTTFADSDAEALLEHPLFDVPVTAESPKRRQMYRQEMNRQVAFEDAGAADYEAFLRSCGIKLTLSLLTEADVTRIYDLSQRTNQLNVTGTRYERRTVEQLARAPGSRLPIVMRCEDRFGDYGVIGFVLLDPDDGLVLDFLMSCRVQRKHVEQALFAHLVTVVAARGARSLRCRYRRTERNALALQLLGELGFQLRPQAREVEPGAGMLERDLSPVPGADVVELIADGITEGVR